jgi:hypothetical protein
MNAAAALLRPATPSAFALRGFARSRRLGRRAYDRPGTRHEIRQLDSRELIEARRLRRIQGQ